MPDYVRRRDDRLELRLPPAAKAMLKRAADVERKSVSSFLLDKGLQAAAEALAEQTEFRLGARQFDAFVAALDSPEKPRRRLDVLMTTPSVLE